MRGGRRSRDVPPGARDASVIGFRAFDNRHTYQVRLAGLSWDRALSLCRQGGCARLPRRRRCQVVVGGPASAAVRADSGGGHTCLAIRGPAPNPRTRPLCHLVG